MKMKIYFLALTQVCMKLLKNDYNDKYEYILPEITLDKKFLPVRNLW